MTRPGLRMLDHIAARNQIRKLVRLFQFQHFFRFLCWGADVWRWENEVLLANIVEPKG